MIVLPKLETPNYKRSSFENISKQTKVSDEKLTRNKNLDKEKVNKNESSRHELSRSSSNRMEARRSPFSKTTSNNVVLTSSDLKTTLHDVAVSAGKDSQELDKTKLDETKMTRKKSLEHTIIRESASSPSGTDKERFSTILKSPIKFGSRRNSKKTRNTRKESLLMNGDVILNKIV